MANQNLQVSIITVCYNSAQTIERCVRSVALQNYCQIEHIIIDGASKDNTVNIIKSINFNNRTLISEQDGGIYDAMNKGLAKASGDIICFLNSDDWYSSNSVISDVVDKFITDKLDLLLTNVILMSSGDLERQKRVLSAKRFHPNKLKYGIMPPHPGIFMSRIFFNKIGNFKSDYKIAGDFDLIVRAFQVSDLFYRIYDYATVCMAPGGVSNAGIKNKIILNLEVVRSGRENCLNISFFNIFIKYLYKLIEALFYK